MNRCFAEERKKYMDVKTGFEAFFVPKKNAIYEEPSSIGVCSCREKRWIPL